jgi:hypothetical protein
VRLLAQLDAIHAQRAVAYIGRLRRCLIKPRRRRLRRRLRGARHAQHQLHLVVLLPLYASKQLNMGGNHTLS